MAGLRALDAARSSLRHQFSAGHESQAVTLFRLFEVMRSHKNRRACVCQAVDHHPESAPSERIDSRGGLIEEEHPRFVHDGGAESDTLLPASRQTASDLVFLPFESRERHHPADFLVALALGHAVDAREKAEIFTDGHIVVEGELLRHVTDLLANAFRAEVPLLAGKPHASAGGLKQSTQHPDRGSLASAICTQKAVDFSIRNLKGYILYRSERSKLFRQIVRSDRNLAAQVRVVVAPGKRWILGLFAETSQAGNEHVLESRLIDANVANVQAGFATDFFNDLACFARVMCQNVKTITKTLHIHNVFLRTGYL